MILRLKGISALSDFRTEKLLKQLKQTEPKITAVSAEYVHFIDSNKQLSTRQQQVLKNLMTYDTPYIGTRRGDLFLVVPRPGTISPWSSKATSIAHNSGLYLSRIERGIAYYVESSSRVDRQLIGGLLHDRMTETVFDRLEQADRLFQRDKPRPFVSINILKNGKKALVSADKRMGLALSPDEIEYLYESYRGINRNPTDLELMMFGVVNSEHCRHKIFNADWFIDGKKQPKSLFKMIKNTYEKNPQNVISAYSDNSAIITGHKENQLQIDPKTNIYTEKIEQTHLVAKVETHNHPTAIAPFPGAATGSGGEIRDENATGRGARAKMGLTGFSVSNLCIPDFIQPWENNARKPDTIASPLEIMLKGPIGGASFNNEYGRPNTAGYFRTYENHQQSDKDEDSWGYHKPIMIAGGVGAIKNSSKDKRRIPPGAKLIVLGGPSMLIGLAGGAASSMESGKSDAELDFASVQRGNAEIQRRAFEVINSCSALEEKNPIISLHDVGAGGLSNALTELVHDSGLGAEFELRNIDSAEPGLSPMEIWCNESQERYVLAIDEKDLKIFKSICAKERCPYSVVGETIKEANLVISDSLFKNQPANIPMSLLFGGPPKITKRTKSREQKGTPLELPEISVDEAMKRVLRIPSVGSKKFLITIGDRNVGGLVARDQMAGPWQVPVSDCAVSATSFFGNSGEAMAMGERTPLAIINAPASARMAIAEAITNIAAASVGKLSDIKLSANWMAASGYKSEDYNLYETVKAIGEEFCPGLGLTIPVGKDSLSMRAVWQKNNKKYSVASPVSLIVSAFAPVNDINCTLTPELENSPGSTLVFLDLSEGKTRLGGSALAQAYGQTGNRAPDVDNPQVLPKFFDCIQLLNKKSLVAAYHDRSDGGLLTTLLEMSFAGRSGLDIDVTGLPGSVLEKLFNEEIGAVLQIPAPSLGKAEKIISKYLGRNFYKIGSPAKGSRVLIKDRGKAVLDSTRAELETAWAETSYRLQKIRDNQKCAEQEYELIEDSKDPGINAKVTFENFVKTPKTRPKVAILREQGVNGQNEMAAAFTLAGFSTVDVHMHDLLTNKFSLDEFGGLAICGGFSYGDVLGAGLGWAKNILYDESLKRKFKSFFEREDTFSLGICNGCQVLSGLRGIIPGAENWPGFLKNESEQFEARLISVKINKSPSIFFKDMEGSVLPIPVAHGEGRAAFKSSAALDESFSGSLVPLQFVDNYHQPTQTYPYNPNGSPQAVASLSSRDGRALIMMPHPERAFLSYQNSWRPKDWGVNSPWLRMFQNARAWVENR